MQKWEYKVVMYPESDLNDLNALGAEGWELLYVQGDTYMYFKRPLPDGI